MSALWRGYIAGLMYAGAYVVLAPLWLRDWDGPIRRWLASGIETEGHDPEEGHGAKHESQVPEGQTPNPCGDSRHD